jgi:hypothetical protein
MLRSFNWKLPTFLDNLSVPSSSGKPSSSTAVFALNGTNQLVVVMEMQFVFCQVMIELLRVHGAEARFRSWPVCLRFVVSRAALGQALLYVIRFSLVIIISAVIHTHLCINRALIRRKANEALEPLNKARCFGNREHWIRHIHSYLFTGIILAFVWR